MKKLTLSVADDVYDLLHAQVGRGRIGRYLSDMARPLLLAGGAGGVHTDTKKSVSAFGMLSHLAKGRKPPTDTQLEEARMKYFYEREARRVASFKR